jgi:cytochrome c oxidase subunit 2
MNLPFRLFPERAATTSYQVDNLFFFELAVSCVFVALIAGLVIYFAIRYRRRSEDEVPPRTQVSTALEATYTIVPFALMMIMFVWGSRVYIRAKRPPANAMQINVIGKQWMWKIQHPEGAREINCLHVPVGRPIKLLMISQDVIHDFGLPDFRIKQDVVPGSYSTEWFQATKTGEYHLFCDQYCGELHSKMIGTVVVMEPAAYQAWLAGVVPGEAPAVTGQRLFYSYGCANCHGQFAPTMAGLYMSKVFLDNEQTVIADEEYLHESIVAPANKLVAGYGPVMPTFQGQLTEEQIFDLIEYIKSLGATMNNRVPGASAAGPQTMPSTQPVNGQRPDLMPNWPPARVPPAYNQTGGSRERE